MKPPRALRRSRHATSSHGQDRVSGCRRAGRKAEGGRTEGSYETIRRSFTSPRRLDTRAPTGGARATATTGEGREGRTHETFSSNVNTGRLSSAVARSVSDAAASRGMTRACTHARRRRPVERGARARRPGSPVGPTDDLRPPIHTHVRGRSLRLVRLGWRPGVGDSRGGLAFAPGPGKIRRLWSASPAASACVVVAGPLRSPR